MEVGGGEADKGSMRQLVGHLAYTARKPRAMDVLFCLLPSLYSVQDSCVKDSAIHVQYGSSFLS